MHLLFFWSRSLVLLNKSRILLNKSRILLNKSQILILHPHFSGPFGANVNMSFRLGVNLGLGPIWVWGQFGAGTNLGWGQFRMGPIWGRSNLGWGQFGLGPIWVWANLVRANLGRAKMSWANMGGNPENPHFCTIHEP